MGIRVKIAVRRIGMTIYMRIRVIIGMCVCVNIYMSTKRRINMRIVHKSNIGVCIRMRINVYIIRMIPMWTITMRFI